MPDNAELVFDSDHAADWIAANTGLDRDTVSAVLAAELDYLVAHGFTDQED